MKPFFFLLMLLFVAGTMQSQPRAQHNLVFDSLATRWDEAMPMGNGWLGALVWKKDNAIRISLDRIDLWDERPMKDIDKLHFKWVQEKVRLNQYDSVQRLGDASYEQNAAPTKIPGAAIEFDAALLGKCVSNVLDITTGLNTVRFTTGTVMRSYVHATRMQGSVLFENLPDNKMVAPVLIVPPYHTGRAGQMGSSTEGQGLERLGYPAGVLTKKNGSIRYHQDGWNGFYYEVLVEYLTLPAGKLAVNWTISVKKPAVLAIQKNCFAPGAIWEEHARWWKNYWSKSSITIPDTLVEKQYYLEMYKFGSVARENTPPISLQAVWTADNGNLPPWKGDYHHDLNTQLSYWPGYSGNHTDLTSSYTNWLWKIRAVNRRWTKHYFGTAGLNVPGVTTLSGTEMGGWVQYSMSPTTVAWLAQHFYWQWRYTGDSAFLKQRLIPYFREAAIFLESIMKKVNGKLQLPLSSSPEYHDNTIRAWFPAFTNYDLALVRNFYQEAIECSDVKSSSHYREVLTHLPDFDINQTGLTIAPGQDLEESHRHHAQLMAIYPLGLLTPDNNDQKEIINRSLRWLEQKGTRNWCGYSFSWTACLYARARQADSAARMLSIFASNFCSSNSFHLNGDQRGGQYSSFTYRPFTLEGNFAFAQGLHEMLLQSYQGYVEVFPSTPVSWKDIGFRHLLAEGAFLVSANKSNGVPESVEVTAQHAGTLKIKLPFKTWIARGADRKQFLQVPGNVVAIPLKKGQTIVFTNGYE
ncbi:MAG: glycoside hydrolase N-terminal domain-containing protein [Bacteroidota bacterium]|nr:glycoside hydrolase N-terminal domain-containing protein [Bacteroidota bacterium]